MNKISTPNNEATVCVNKTCLTVQGEAAQIINVIAVLVTLIAATAVIYKLAR